MKFFKGSKSKIKKVCFFGGGGGGGGGWRKKARVSDFFTMNLN